MTTKRLQGRGILSPADRLSHAVKPSNQPLTASKRPCRLRLDAKKAAMGQNACDTTCMFGEANQCPPHTIQLERVFTGSDWTVCLRPACLSAAHMSASDEASP